MKLVRHGKRLLVLLVALPIIAVGIVLIPLTGPGILITLLGLSILGLEFEKPRKQAILLRRKLEVTISESFKKFDERIEKIDKK